MLIHAYKIIDYENHKATASIATAHATSTRLPQYRKFNMDAHTPKLGNERPHQFIIGYLVFNYYNHPADWFKYHKEYTLYSIRKVNKLNLFGEN